MIKMIKPAKNENCSNLDDYLFVPHQLFYDVTVTCMEEEVQTNKPFKHHIVIY